MRTFIRLLKSFIFQYLQKLQFRKANETFTVNRMNSIVRQDSVKKYISDCWWAHLLKTTSATTISIIRKEHPKVVLAQNNIMVNYL